MLLKETTHSLLGRIKGKIPNVKLNFIGPSRVEAASTTGTHATTRTLSFRAALVHAQGSAIQLSLVHLGDCLFSSIPSRESHKAESTRTLRVAIHWEKDICDGTKLTKLITKTLFISG
jgi:hypothetical protein